MISLSRIVFLFYFIFFFSREVTNGEAASILSRFYLELVPLSSERRFEECLRESFLVLGGQGLKEDLRVLKSRFASCFILVSLALSFQQNVR